MIVDPQSFFVSELYLYPNTLEEQTTYQEDMAMIYYKTTF